MFFSKLSLLCFVAILGTSWFSEGGFTAVEAYPQQYSSQFGAGNQQATTQDGWIWQQYIGQYYNQQPTVVYRFPETRVNPYENRPVLNFLHNLHNWKMCMLSGFHNCYQ
uniref:Uncharacterized protein n=1 Tax=Glyptapanteles indiensis TaxID=92994 RepID=A0JCY2_GLYIN|nr:hypothetical protein GIP_L1_00610 [Glyptapanteles indiensis]